MSNQLTQYVSEYPLTWDVQRIKYLLLDGKDGIRIGPFGSSLKLEDMVDDGYKVYGQENVINKNFEVGKRYLSDDKFEELKQYEVFKNDILITMMGTTGKVIIVPENTKKGIMDSHLIRVRFNRTKVDNRFFVYQIMESIISQHQIKVRSKGSIMEGLNSSIIKSLYLTLPPLETQKQIADFLDKETTRIDTLISKKQKQIELLQEKRQAIITQSVTKGLNENVKMKDSGVEWIGEIPEHWDTLKMRFLFSFTGGGTPSTENPEYWGGEIPWVSSKDMKTDFITDTQDHITELGVQESSTNLIPKGTLLIVMRSGILQHSIPCSITEVVVSVNQDIKAFIPKKKIVPDLYSLFIKGYQKQLLFQWRKQGATVESLDLELIKDFKIVIPPYDEQRNIVEETRILVEKNESVIGKINKSIELLKEYRSSLITHAVSGQINLTELTKATEEER